MMTPSQPAFFTRQISRLQRSSIGKSSWIVIGLILMASLIGAAMPIYVGAMEGHAAKLIAFPAVLVFGLLLMYDRRMVLLLILLLRSSGDVYLDLTKFSIGGAQIGIGGVINVVIIFIGLLFALEKPQLFPKKLSWMWLPFLLYSFLTIIIAPEKGNSIRAFLGVLSNFSVFICATYMVRTEEDFKKMVMLVIWSSLLPAMYAVVDFALHRHEAGFRLRSTFSHFNVLACYLVMEITLLLYVLKSPRFALKPMWRLFFSGYMGYLLILLLMTQTRSAWLACFAVFLAYAVFFDKKYLLYLLLLPLVLLVPQVRDRLSDLGTAKVVVRYSAENSFAWRVKLWEDALHFISPARYLVGYGIDSFPYYSITFFEEAHNINWHAHNVFIQYFFELGLIGLLAFLRVFWTLLAHLRKLMKIEKLAMFIFSATIVQYLIICASDNVTDYLSFNWYFWFSLGVASAFINIVVSADEKVGVTPFDKARFSRSVRV